MKQVILLFFITLSFLRSEAQITITASDMPVVGDTLRYSIASPVDTNIDLNDTGANIAWDFHELFPVLQAVDTYKLAASVNSIYALTISPTAYGYKIADSIPGLSSLGIPVSISDVYTFFNIKSGPSRYIAEAFAARANSIPVAANYSAPDVIYTFPLSYHNSDSNNYSLTITVPGLGTFKQSGYRKNTVDGWGTIVTPYFTAPANCIRVRSEVHEIDSVNETSLGIKMGIPRNFIEYKWLVNGAHYPALQVTASLIAGAPRISSVYYRDYARHTLLSASSVKPSVDVLKVYPNPVANGVLKVVIPSGWENYNVEVFDMLGKEVGIYRDQSLLNVSNLPEGKYLIRVTSGNSMAYASFIK